MGTRHLVCVVKDNDYKIAQYGQYDGYPEHTGVKLLEYLTKRFDQAKLASKLDLIKQVSNYERDKRNRSPESLSLHATTTIMQIVQDANDEVLVVNELSFAQDSLMCEWCYVIDLDKSTFEVYKGCNKKPLGENERFYDATAEPYEAGGGTKYYAVGHVITYDLNALPSPETFLEEF